MTQRIRYFNTERQAERARRKFVKYRSTVNHRWTVQGNALVRIKKRRN